MIDLKQDTLFGRRTISTIGFDEQQLIRDILFLHCNGKPIDCDPTYSVGNFYKHGLPKPRYRFDLKPQCDDVAQASADKLPLEDATVETMMFDPPFVIGGATYDESAEGSCITAKRFTSFTSWEELRQMYEGSLREAHRVLKPKGVMIFKNQDTVAGGLNYFSHVWIMNKAVEVGFYPKDLFILLAKNRLIDGREQEHARKFHCYYWVFEKKASRVAYSAKMTN